MPRKKAPDMSKWASEMDIGATRQLIEELQAEGKPWDKLESDAKKYITNYRRICPKRPEWQNPYQIVPVHYLGPSSRMVVCRKEAGIGECPACNLRWELHDGGAEAESRQLRTSIRTFINVVHIDSDGNIPEDDGKVYLLGLNQLQFLGKRGVEYDPDEESELPLFGFFEKYGDLSHVTAGRDLLIKAKDEKSGDFDVQALKFSVAEPSPFPGTSELLDEGLVDLPEVVTIIEPEEMVAVIEGRATGTTAIAMPGAPAQIAEAATAPAEPTGGSRFGGEEAEEEETEPAATTEEEPAAEEPAAEAADDDARAAAKPPKTDPAAALKRLREQQDKKE